MAIISNAYFINDIQLPLDEAGAKLTSLINRFEPEIIEKCLGFSLKNEFYTWLNAPDTTQKWLDLRDGKIYQIDGISYEWVGFANDRKISIISYFVHVEYLKTTKTITSVGGKTTKSENSDSTDTYIEQCRSFNKAIELMNQLDAFITYANDLDPETYPNYEMSNP